MTEILILLGIGTAFYIPINRYLKERQQQLEHPQPPQFDEIEAQIHQLKPNLQQFEELLKSLRLSPCPQCTKTQFSVISISSSGKTITLECLECGHSQLLHAVEDFNSKQVCQCWQEYQTLLHLLKKYTHLLRPDYPLSEIDIKIPLNISVNGPTISFDSQQLISPQETLSPKQCDRCGSSENLYYVHILPTSVPLKQSRKIEVLCEQCHQSTSNSQSSLQDIKTLH